MNTWKTHAQQHFLQLIDIMEKLRGPQGCPWDKEQTLESLKPYLIEEAYECLETIDDNDIPSHCEELGDLLLQIVFQAEIRRNEGEFDIGHVCESINEKLIRRHPHIFSNISVSNSHDVIKNWEAIKLEEKKTQDEDFKSTLDTIPKSMTQLLQSYHIGRKAARLDFDWPTITGVVDKIDEELGELKYAIQENNKHAVSHEIGDMLMVLVNLARKYDIDPEQSLHHANQRFKDRFKKMEEKAYQGGISLQQLPLEEKEMWWQQAKKELEEK